MGGSQVAVPSLTAARRLHLRRRAWVSAWAVATPYILLLAAYGYKKFAGLSQIDADTVTSAMGYIFAAGTVLAAAAAVRTLHILRTRHNLDTSLRSYTWAMRCSLVAIGSAVVWAMFSPVLVSYFCGAH